MAEEQRKIKFPLVCGIDGALFSIGITFVNSNTGKSDMFQYDLRDQIERIKQLYGADDFYREHVPDVVTILLNIPEVAERLLLTRAVRIERIEKIYQAKSDTSKRIMEVCCGLKLAIPLIYPQITVSSIVRPQEPKGYFGTMVYKAENPDLDDSGRYKKGKLNVIETFCPPEYRASLRAHFHNKDDDVCDGGLQSCYFILNEEALTKEAEEIRREVNQMGPDSDHTCSYYGMPALPLINPLPPAVPKKKRAAAKRPPKDKGLFNSGKSLPKKPKPPPTYTGMVVPFDTKRIELIEIE